MEKAAQARNSRFSESLCYRLSRLATQLSKAAETKLREVSGMSFSQFMVLMALDEIGEAKQSEVATYLGVTPAVMTKQVETMLKRGWLRIGPAHQDRRANLVRLTSEGEQMARLAQRQVEATIVKEFHLSNHYEVKLRHLLEAMN